MTWFHFFCSCYVAGQVILAESSCHRTLWNPLEVACNNIFCMFLTCSKCRETSKHWPSPQPSQYRTWENPVSHSMCLVQVHYCRGQSVWTHTFKVMSNTSPHELMIRQSPRWCIWSEVSLCQKIKLDEGNVLSICLQLSQGSAIAAL